MKYTVIIYPSKPSAQSHAADYSSQTIARPPRVVQVEARTPDQAAEESQVEPGGYCVVVTQSRRFDRASEAPLVERAIDGNPLPTAA